MSKFKTKQNEYDRYIDIQFNLLYPDNTIVIVHNFSSDELMYSFLKNHGAFLAAKYCKTPVK